MKEGDKMEAKELLCSVPPMGWNSWNTFTDHIDENMVRETADVIAENGLRDAGYEYVVIDDCWSLKNRDSGGKLIADPEKFPNGMRALSDYIHSKGLKFGMYSCCGTRTCAGYPGSLEHEFEDAAQFAEWGVDYLKYDNCYKPATQEGQMLYRRMGLALANCGRDIVFSACQWGTDDVHKWIRSTGAQLFRSGPDIQDTWNSVNDIVNAQLDKQSHSGNFCHNDMDMLIVGMYGRGGNEYISAGGCTDEEYQTHFALWCMMNSPLMIGCDVRKMTEKTKEILMNRDLIAINQDPECRSVYRLEPFPPNPDAFILVKPLYGGDLAVGFFNMGDSASNMSAIFWDMGISRAAKRGLSFYDCLKHEQAGTYAEDFTCVVPSHGCRVYRCSVKKL